MRFVQYTVTVQWWSVHCGTVTLVSISLQSRDQQWHHHHHHHHLTRQLRPELQLSERSSLTVCCCLTEARTPHPPPHLYILHWVSLPGSAGAVEPSLLPRLTSSCYLYLSLAFLGPACLNTFNTTSTTTTTSLSHSPRYEVENSKRCHQSECDITKKYYIFNNTKVSVQTIRNERNHKMKVT